MWSRRGHPNTFPALWLPDLTNANRDRTIATVRRLCQVAPLSDGRAVCRVLGRYKLVADTTDLGLSPHLMLDGYWELWISETIRDLVRPGMACVDAGANIGYHTLLMADLVGANGQVHAFEPNPAMRALIGHSLDLNGFTGRATLHDAPLSDVGGQQAALVVPEGQPKNAFLAPADTQAPPGHTLHALRTATLDECLADRAVDLVKIDVEGAEQAVWRGMRDILARGAPLHVILEFTPDRYADPAAFLRELTRPGLHLSRIDHRRGVQPVTPDQVLSAPPREDQTLLLSR